MRRVALRGVRSHLGRFLLSVLAVMLGVSFVAGTFSLRTMLSSTFSELVDTSMVGDAYVLGAEPVAGTTTGTGTGESRTRVPVDLVGQLADVDGVEVAIPEVSGPIVLVGSDGTAVISGGGAPSFAIGLHPDEPSAEVTQGRAPSGPLEVALESTTLQTSGLAVGDTTMIVLGGEQPTEVEVVGEVTFGAPVAGATIVFLDTATAEAVYASDGLVGTIALYGDGLDEQALVDRVSGALPAELEAAGAEVRTGEDLRTETREQVEQILGFVSTFLLVFAAIALFVGAFIIANTFQMTVRQRQRELAMLRALGASPLQVFSSILLQAAVVGVLGSAAGVGAGVALVAGLREVFAAMGMELSGRIPLDTSTVVVAVLVGTLVSLVAAAVPARRAALTPPVEAMRDDVVVHDRASAVRAAAGAVLLLGGLVAVWAAVQEGAENEGTLLGFGAAGVVLGVLVLTPTVVPLALRALAVPVVLALRPLGALARGNVTRHPRRTASTAGALMIGMALVSAASVIAASTQASTRAIVEDESTADLLVQSATWSVPPELVNDVAQVEGVAEVDALGFAMLSIDDEATVTLGVRPGIFDRALSVPVDDGDVGDLTGTTAVVQRSVARERGWDVGTVLTLRGGAGSADVTVAAVIDSRALSAVVVTDETLEALVPAAERTIDTVFLTLDPQADAGQVRERLDAVAERYVVVSILDNEQYADQLADQVDQILVILYALLGLSIVIAVLGIVNTLALSIAERTREIGLLRAVGLGRLQLATVVTIESVLTAVFGTVLGIAVGTGLASTLPTVYADDGLSTLVVPWDLLGVFVGLAVVVGVVAAVWPAVRASRMDVLQAISYE